MKPGLRPCWDGDGPGTRHDPGRKPARSVAGEDMPEAARATTRAALLRARRARALLSQEELAERAGLSVRTVRNIEAQRLVRPHPDTVRRISAALTAAGAPPADPDGGHRGEDRPEDPKSAAHQLPSAIADFTGRDAEVRQLCGLLEREPAATGAARVLSVAGLGGVGKTALAVHVAHLVRDHFEDGQLYVDLHGCGPAPRRPDEVLAQFLLALGVTAIPDGLEERAALYRSVLDGRQMLVLLDNAADEAQVRPLVAGAGCAHLVTSRIRLLGLEGARTTVLDVLGAADSAALLGRIAGTDRVAHQPAAERIGTACGGLPLAIRIAAARLAARPHWGPATLADLLDDERERLDELKAGDLEVRASFELSYRMLDEAQRRAFRTLALLEAPDFPGWVLAALLGPGDGEDDPATDRGLRRANVLTEQLVDAQLLQISGLDRIGQTRYRIHDLLRVYGRERALAEDAAGDRRAALLRVLS
ncbi:MAG: helix-turn-helix domain-containing protein, partial [Pseudonocardiaceae bacterium]|nr:helix-turn-helix domain-containing protein [Pseudonocardiaceae bacterium]